MSSVIFSLPEIYNAYKKWVSSNPQSVGDWEMSAKWISYFIAGRINNSHVLSELVYCLSNLLVMLNDRIIIKNSQVNLSTSVEKLKLLLTIVEYSEVFCELSAKKLWGKTGRWIVIVSIQVFKCISRLMLIYHHKECMVQSPPIPALDRKKLKSNYATVTTDVTQSQFDSVSFTLKRTGRVVRKVDASPPLALRTWKPLQTMQSFNCENEQTIEQASAGIQLVAETMYIAKPIMHLVSMACFGTKAWKPWMLSLALDCSSLQLYRSCKSKKINCLTAQQRLQLSRRTVILILYLIRSPFYEKQSKDKIHAFLMMLSKRIPLAGLICNPLAQYLPFWQNTYFYMWST